MPRSWPFRVPCLFFPSLFPCFFITYSLLIGIGYSFFYPPFLSSPFLSFLLFFFSVLLVSRFFSWYVPHFFRCLLPFPSILSDCSRFVRLGYVCLSYG